MADRKLKKNLRELDSLRQRAHSRVYNKKSTERKRRLLRKIRRLKASE